MKKLILSTVISLSITAINVHAQPGLRSAKTTTNDACKLTSVAALFYITGSDVFAPNDSSSYSYSNGRGSQFIPGEPPHFRSDYDTMVVYEPNGSSFARSVQYIQTFDAHNNVVSNRSKLWRNWLNDWSDFRREVSTYDAADNQLTLTKQYWDSASAAWLNDSRIVNTYTFTNRINSSITQYWNIDTGSWQHAEWKSYTYDVADALISGYEYNWNTITGAWDSLTKDAYQYNAFGKVSTKNMYYTDWMGALKLSARESYTYDTSQHKIGRLLQLWNAGSATWQNADQTLYSNYSGNTPGTTAVQMWNDTMSVFIDVEIRTYTFNSFNLPTSIYTKAWDGLSGSWYYNWNSGRIHYDDCIEAAASDIKNIECKILLYPNPANDIVNVEVTLPTRQQFTISITDMLGRLVGTWSVPECDHHTACIPLHNLDSGNYILKIEGSKDNKIERFMVGR